MNSLFNISLHLKERTFNKEVKYKNRRDEIISNMVEEINKLRVGTKYKPVTKRFIAIKVNGNPFLKDDGELELIFKECLKKGSFAKLFWICR